MRARVGDLAIARFDLNDDDIKDGRKWNKKVGLVTGTGIMGPNSTRYCEFIYWDHRTRHCDIISCNLPPHRLVRARPINDDWEGTLSSLTLDSVELV